MLITADILFDLLSTTYTIQRCGAGLPGHSLHLPVFYDDRSVLRQDGVYVLRTQNLPTAPEAECLYLCVGGRPVRIPGNYRGEIFCVETTGVDIPEIFNRVQEIFEKLIDWEFQLQRLVNDGADIRELVRVSIPILENRIAVVDYGLRMIAHCRSVEIDGHREIRMSELFDTIPEKKTAAFQKIYYSTRELRHPFRYNDWEDDCYCINLYTGNSYVGACSLIRDLREFRDSDFALFQVLAEYLRLSLSAQSGLNGSRFVSMKIIFTQLLSCLAVSRQEAETALEEYRSESEPQHPVFVCYVLRSRLKGRTLPSEYLCEVLEKLAGESTAIEFENALVLFCRFPSEERRKRESDLSDQLEPLLKDMNFRVGVSEPFADVFRARTGYLQASCALETGQKQSPDELFFRFRDYAVYYMLEHCRGEFESDQLMPDSLRELSECGRGGSYIETLRCYLDNECNASRTADAMYLHRSTLTPKIEKIRSLVDLETPEQRLYLRLCLKLMSAEKG